VLVDVTSWGSRRGAGRFVRNIVSRLVELDDETTYVLLHPESAAWASDLPARAERRAVRIAERSGPSSRSVGDVRRLVGAARASRTRALVFPVIGGWFPFGGAPSVVGVHDLIGATTPHLLFARRRSRILWRAKETIVLRRAGAVFAVSETTRRELAQRFELGEAVEVVQPAPDPAFRRPAPAELERRLADWGLEPNAYLLYSGGISPRKGLDTLISAYAALRASRGTMPALVVAGQSSWGERARLAQGLRRRVAEAGLESAVMFPGFVPDDDLACMYAGAVAAVNASEAEGFGFPAVEAAACGTPCLLSDIPAHRETLDGAASFFEPGSASALQAALESLLDDPRRRQELAGRALSAVARLSWDEAARRLRAVIEKGMSQSAGRG
jgi:glycosyltransferase involved in cell wall biosynthesis